jgi:hypothetical protein
LLINLLEDTYESIVSTAYELLVNPVEATVIVINPNKSYANFTRLSKIAGIFGKENPKLTLKYFYIEKEIESLKKQFQSKSNDKRLSRSLVNLVIQEELSAGNADLSYTSAERYTSSFRILTYFDLFLHTGPSLKTFMSDYDGLEQKEKSLKSLNNKELNEYIVELREEYLMAKVEFSSTIDQEIRYEVLDAQQRLINLIIKQDINGLLQNETPLNARNWIYNKLRELGND